MHFFADFGWNSIQTDFSSETVFQKASFYQRKVVFNQVSLKLKVFYRFETEPLGVTGMGKLKQLIRNLDGFPFLLTVPLQRSDGFRSFFGGIASLFYYAAVLAVIIFQLIVSFQSWDDPDLFVIEKNTGGEFVWMFYPENYTENSPYDNMFFLIIQDTYCDYVDEGEVFLDSACMDSFEFGSLSGVFEYVNLYQVKKTLILILPSPSHVFEYVNFEE